MARFPVYTRDGDVVRTTQDTISPAELCFAQFPIDATGGAVTYQVAEFGQTGFNYRILGIYHNITVGLNGFVRYNLYKPPFVLLQENSVTEVIRPLTAVNQDYGSLSDGAPNTNTLIGTNDYSQLHFPAIVFDSRMSLEITLTNGNFGLFTVYYEKVTK